MLVLADVRHNGRAQALCLPSRREGCFRQHHSDRKYKYVGYILWWRVVSLLLRPVSTPIQDKQGCTTVVLELATHGVNTRHQ